MAEEWKPLEVYDLIALSLDQFAALAWQKMGLHPDPITRKVEPHLDQARLAIDVAAHLAQALEPNLGDEDRRRVQSLMSDLRINYVRISQATIKQPDATTTPSSEAAKDRTDNQPPPEAPKSPRVRKKRRATNDS